MSDNTTAQTVADETDVGTTQFATEGETVGAQDDINLDDLLKEFDLGEEETSNRNPQPAANTTAADTPDLAEITMRLAQLEELRAKERERALDETIGRINADAKLPPRVARAYLEGRAQEDPRIAAAYVNRDRNPKAWAEIEKKLAREMTEEFGRNVDKHATFGRDAVAAAVRGSATAARKDDLTPSDVLSMPTDEWQELQRKFGLTPW